MEIIAIIPLFACLAAIFMRGTQYAFQNVALPVLLLMPTYFLWSARPLPSFNFLEAAFFGMGIGIVMNDLRRWQFTRSDLWMAPFMLSCCYTDYTYGRHTEAIFTLFSTINQGLVPYMAGKLLVEYKNGRIETARRIVWLLFIAATISTFEYVFKKNPFQLMFNHFFPSQWSGWVTQIRWGFGRVAGPFAQSELAGIIFSFGFLLALWLAKRKYLERGGTVKLPARLDKPKLLIAGLLIILLMTQARGPWIGTLLALAVAYIGRAKDAGKRAILVIGLLVGIVIPAYTISKSWVAGPRTDYGSERETAQYRAELLDNYIPVAQHGGPWGWGLIFPRIHGQISIDNEYLFVWVVQGWVGAIAFCLLLLESAIGLVTQAVRVKTTQDRHFILTLLGVMLGMAFIIATVFLGAQSYPIFFFLIGWCQAVGKVRFPALGQATAERARATPERNLIRVYT